MRQRRLMCIDVGGLNQRGSILRDSCIKLSLSKYNVTYRNSKICWLEVQASLRGLINSITGHLKPKVISVFFGHCGKFKTVTIYGALESSHYQMYVK